MSELDNAAMNAAEATVARVRALAEDESRWIEMESGDTYVDLVDLTRALEDAETVVPDGQLPLPSEAP